MSIEQILRPALSDNEQLLWSAKADLDARMKRRDQILTFFIIIETLSLGVVFFLTFGAMSASRSHLVIVAWAMAAAAIAAGAILYRALGKMGNEIYALTQKRVLIVSAETGALLRSMELEKIRTATMRTRRDGTIDIRFDGAPDQGSLFVFQLLKASDYNSGLESQFEKHCAVKIAKLELSKKLN